jgi:hypothetical protein
MKPAKKIFATLAVAGGLAAGAVGVGTGVASADPGPWYGNGNGHGWHGDGHNGRGWDGPGWDGRGWGNGPIPGGWNGGWQPWGGVCLFGACI